MRLCFAFIWIAVLGLFSCASAPASKGDKKKIVATTGMIADLVQHIVGDAAEVQALMGPGVDPHLYKATQGDLMKLEQADVIVYNGLHLEGKMAEVFEGMARKKPGAVLALGSYLQSEDLIFHGATAPDPHIWFDPILWAKAGTGLATDLAKLWPEQANAMQQAMAQYALELKQADSSFQSVLTQVPKTQQVLITSHDAFGYFGRRYQWEVKGLQGISTTAEFGLQDVTNMIDLVTTRKIKALFVESSVSSKSIESVVEGCARKGWNVQLGGHLYSDAMGEAQTPEGSYVGMLTHNVQTIVNALK